MSTPLIVILAIIAILIIWVIVLYNGLVRERNVVGNAFSDINVQLKKRYDLIPNLVETVKGYKNHEASVLEAVTQARSNAMNAQTNMNIPNRVNAENALTGALKSLFAVAESYPDLKASANFQNLQENLTAIENDIQSARRYYNAAVREYNTAIQVFPSNLVANTFHFTPSEFFGIDANETANVNVSF